MSQHHSTSTVQEFIRNVENTLGPRSGPAAYARAARRYGFETPLWAGREGIVFRKLLEDDSGSGSEVPAEDVQNDLEYVVPVKIGTPGVTLKLDFDTGSSDLWVWSNELRSRSTSGHTIYNPANSSTSQVVEGAKWKISYGDGSSASGDVYTDTIALGSISLPGQGVELASKLSSSFLQEGGSDGLLGLAWPALNTVTPSQEKTPVENLIEQGLLAQPLFTAMLDKGDSNGFYSFGIIDAAKAGVKESDIVYTPVDSSQGFWMFNSTSAVINGKKISRSSNTAIADTGTTLCLLDDSTVQAIYDNIPGATMDQSSGGWVYPADATVPEVQLAVGDALFTINPADFAYGPSNGGQFFGGIQSRGNNPFDIFGDVFLKSVYVVFDQGNTRIGMVQRPAT